MKASAEAGAQGHIVALGRIEERVGAIEKFLKINGGAVPAERHPA